MENVIRYRHSVNSGDAVASLAGIKSIYEQSGKKAVFMQEIGRPADYYTGASHPVKENGVQVTMSNKQWEMLRPLLLSQEYIDSATVYRGQPIDVNLDRIRSECFVNMPYGHLASWIMLAFPDMHYDLSKPWIDIKTDRFLFNATPSVDMVDMREKVLINFTERYRTNTVDYFFLKKYQDILVFAGLSHESDIFCERWGLDMPLLLVSDFLELAAAMKSCKFFMGNQSTCWNIANAMGEPRLLEMASIAPNCIPFIGEKNYGYFHTGACEYYFNKLLNS